MRLPKEASKRDGLAVQIGAEGYALMDAIFGQDDARHLRQLPALEILRQMWLQQYYRCTEPGMEAVRWRGSDERPPAALQIQSPYDLEARYSTKRDTQWVGYKAHLSETCDDGYPDLITQVMTTLATTPDCVMGPAIQQDLAQRDVLPGTHLLDSGYVDAEFLASAQRLHQIDVIGPPFGSYSRQRRAGTGYALDAFILDWPAQQARCPEGHTSVKWTPGHDMRGGLVVRIRFETATCRACKVRSACTWAKKLSQSPISRARRRIHSRAQASCSSPKKLTAFFSYRTRRPRHFESHASVRSTTQRRAGCVFWPWESSFSSPMRRICGVYWYATTVSCPVGLS
jgi:transposase